MIADREIQHAIAQRLHHTGGLMPQRHRQRARAIAVDDRKIGMAQPGRNDPDQHLVPPGRIERDRFDRQRAAVGIGEAGAGAAQDGGLDLHGKRVS